MLSILKRSPGYTNNSSRRWSIHSYTFCMPHLKNCPTINTSMITLSYKSTSKWRYWYYSLRRITGFISNKEVMKSSGAVGEGIEIDTIGLALSLRSDASFHAFVWALFVLKCQSLMGQSLVYKKKQRSTWLPLWPKVINPGRLAARLNVTTGEKNACLSSAIYTWWIVCRCTWHFTCPPLKTLSLRLLEMTLVLFLLRPHMHASKAPPYMPHSMAFRWLKNPPFASVADR